MKSRLRYVLVDTASGRLLDYVNLASSQSADLTASVVDSGCGTNYSPIYSPGGIWCTNLPITITQGVDPNETFGVRLQVDVSSGIVRPDWTSSLPDPLYGRDKDKGIGRFLFQFGLWDGYPPPGEPPYELLNSFPAPFSPFRTIHLVAAWQAKDPLVHYTVADLKNLTIYPAPVYLDMALPPLPPTQYGSVNWRYEPWGGNPIVGSTSPTKFDLTVKDPVAVSHGTSDDWGFPTSPYTATNWLGRVHRGTPWQTVYLKAPAAASNNWVSWIGNPLLVTNVGQLSLGLLPIGAVTYDAMLAHPTNDWRLAGMLASLLSANDSHQSLSANQARLPDWLGRWTAWSS